MSKQQTWKMLNTVACNGISWDIAQIGSKCICTNVEPMNRFRHGDIFGEFPWELCRKRSCSSEGDKDLLTRQLALCLRHHSFGLRERFCLICTCAELTLTGFYTPPQCQLLRSNILKQNIAKHNFGFINCLSLTAKQAGAHSFFFLWCGKQTAVACNMLCKRRKSQMLENIAGAMHRLRT